MPRERFYSLAMKAGGFLDVKKNGDTLEVDVRGLLDLERWSMLNYLRACFYNAGTNPGTYKWYFEDSICGFTGTVIPDSDFKKYSGTKYMNYLEEPFYRYRFLFACCTGVFSRKRSVENKTDAFPRSRNFMLKNAGMSRFGEINEVVKVYFSRPLSISYSDAVTNAKPVQDGDIVHNSHLKVEAKIGLADNKLPFNEKFKEEAKKALYECIETAYPAVKNKNVGWIGRKKKPKSAKKDNAGAEIIVEKVDTLIEYYDKKRKGYTLTFSDLMSIDELRLLIQGNFEQDHIVENGNHYSIPEKHKWAKQGFDEKNAKKLEALIRDTFVFHDIYAVNFLLANKFVQDAFIKVNIPTEFSRSSPMFVFKCKTVDDRLRNVGRNQRIEKDPTGYYRIVKDTADSMYSFDGIKSLGEKYLVEFLGQEFYEDYKKGINLKFKEKTQGLDAITKLSDFRDDQLADLHIKILKENKPSTNNQQEKDQVLEKIAKGIRDEIRNLLKDVLKGRYNLYYSGGGHGDVKNVIKYDYANGFPKDGKQFSEAFDYLALEGETGRLAELNDRELKLVRGRDKNQDINGIINMAIDEDDGIMNLQILKILCKKLSVFCAEKENDQKLYLFPYPWNDDLKKRDVGSICDISDDGVEHTTYYYDYTGDDGKTYNSEPSLEYEFDEKIGVMKPILSKHAKIGKDQDHKHSLLLKRDVFTDKERMEKGLPLSNNFLLFFTKKNPWDRVRNFCSFSNYANVKLRIYDDSLKFIRKETDDVICFDVPNDLKLKRFTEDSGGAYKKSNDGTNKIYFEPNGGFHIEPATKWNYDNP